MLEELVDRVARVMANALELHGHKLAVAAKEDDVATMERIRAELWENSDYNDYNSMK